MSPEPNGSAVEQARPCTRTVIGAGATAQIRDGRTRYGLSGPGVRGRPPAGVPRDQQWVTAREKLIVDEPVFFTFTL
jgi:hypothetical protein